MPKIIQINDSVKMMKLNIENRNRFIDVILTATLKHRSDKVRSGMSDFNTKLIERTFGKTPQARTANRKKIETIQSISKKLKDVGLKCDVSVIRRDYDLNVNMAGLTINIYFKKPFTGHTVQFEREFLSYDGSERITHQMGSDHLTLLQDDKLIKQFNDLKDEAESINNSSEELRAILKTIFGKSKTLGAALEKWPELSEYVPAIMSSCREIIVPTHILNKRIDALTGDKMTTSKAMKLGK